MTIVADTGPLNYLYLIGHLDILETLYQQILLPTAVQQELLKPAGPAGLRSLLQAPPAWLQIMHVPARQDPETERLDPGERDAIHLAESQGVRQLLMDEIRGRRVALQRGLAVIGTLGVLRTAGQRNLLDVRAALQKLEQTSFYMSPDLLTSLFGDMGK